LPALKIELVKTLAEPEDRSTVWSRDDAPELFDELHLVGKLEAKLLISPESGDRFLLTGKLSGVQNLVCSRTLEPFDRPFSTEMVVEVTRCQVAKQELDDEDADVYAYRIPQNQEFVEVSECVRELVILQEPQAPVKNPEENFIFVSNETSDEGAGGGEKPMDPRWEKLKALKSKMENRS
jgi:uncharacterized protein